MAGGTFDKLVGKVRPGTYANFVSTVQNRLGTSDRGVVVVPLFTHIWGPSAEFLELDVDAPDKEIVKLGFSVYDDDTNKQMLLIREAFKNARTVYVYRVNTGTKASATIALDNSVTLTATAKYGGTRGNKLAVVLTANTVSGFDVAVYLDSVKVTEYEGLSTIGDLVACNDPYIDFTGTASSSLSAKASTSLTGGTDVAATSGNLTTFLDDLEKITWNTLAFPVTDSGQQASAKAKIKYMRENMGRKVQVVMPDTASNDYEGVINVVNSVKLGDVSLTHAQACAWVAGSTAAAGNTESLTYRQYEGATDLVDAMTHAQAVAAINAGKFFFSMNDAGVVVVEYDINSLVTFSGGKDESYRKNRVIRVFDTFNDAIRENFPPNKFDNSEEGWAVMEGIGKSILRLFEDAGAIKNVDYDADFAVDQSASTGDSTYFDVRIQPIDSAEKLYFTVKTN